MRILLKFIIIVIGKLTVIFVNTKERTAQSVIEALKEAHLRLNLKTVENQLVLIKDKKFA